MLHRVQAWTCSEIGDPWAAVEGAPSGIQKVLAETESIVDYMLCQVDGSSVFLRVYTTSCIYIEL